MESVDYISKLPDHIIHHILSLIEHPKEVARTSILSKRWRELWYSFSCLTFKQRDFAFKKDFLNYVDKSLKLNIERDTVLHKLSIHMVSFDVTIRNHLDNWLDLVTEGNIRDLDINIGLKKKRHDLPKRVFLIDSLSRLRLCGCRLIGLNDYRIMLPRLQKLCLVKVKLDEQTIKSFVSNCKDMEDLRLIQCSGLKALQICDHIKLNRVEIHKCNQLRKVELGCSNLHTFWFQCKEFDRCKVNFDGCTSLKKLTLGHVQHEFIEKFECFPHLETLDLRKLNFLESIEISTPKLQMLALKGCSRIKSVSINAPNLESFVFQGYKMPLIEMHPCSFGHTKLCFGPDKYCGPLKSQKQCYFTKVMDFLRTLDCGSEYKFFVQSQKNIVIYENLDQVLLPQKPCLSIDIVLPSLFSKVFESLMCKYHPETLCMVFPSNKEFPELVYEEMKNSKRSASFCNCCTIFNKCWRHSLKDIEIEDFGDAGNDWTCAWLQWLKSEQMELPQHLTTFRLYWKDL